MHTGSHCGLPRRLRPGFRYNNECYCGTAGVLTLEWSNAPDIHERHCAHDLARILVKDPNARSSTTPVFAGRITNTAPLPRTRNHAPAEVWAGRHHPRIAPLRPNPRGSTTLLHHAMARPPSDHIVVVVKCPASHNPPWARPIRRWPGRIIMAERLRQPSSACQSIPGVRAVRSRSKSIAGPVHSNKIPNSMFPVWNGREFSYAHVRPAMCSGGSS